MKKIIKAVFVITFFAVATRGLGFVLRIFLSRKLGAEMLGVYQVALSIFGVFCTLVASGIPLIISRNVSSARAQNQSLVENRIVSSGFLISVSISILICITVLLFPQSLSFMLANKKSVNVLLFLLPGVVASAVYCTFRGALWGQKRFFWISFSEFFEQVARIAVVFILFELLFNSKNGGELAAISLSVACILSAILVFILFFVYGGKLASPFKSAKSLIKSATPITTIRTASSIGQSAIAILIPLQLIACGMTKSEALSLFGIAVGMALPLIMIPSTLEGAFATAIIPEISENYVAEKNIKNNPNFRQIKRKINTSINVTLFIGFLLVPAYFFLGKQIGVFLFGNVEAGIYTARACFLMIPITMSGITSSILNSIGFEIKSLINYAIGSVLMFACVYFLPKYIGINSLIVGMAMLSTTTSALNIFILSKNNLVSAKHLKTALYLTLFLIPSGLAAKYTFLLFNLFAPMFISLMLAGLISVVLFFGCSILFKQVDISLVLAKKRAKKTAVSN